MPRRDDTPRDLLFGLLALQNGMITRDQLVAAFGAWSAAADRRMADLLVEQGALSAPRRELLAALAAEHLVAHGDDPSRSLAALGLDRSTREILAAAGPEIEATLAHPGSGSGDDPGPIAAFAVGSATGDGQRFRVLRPHARGGLGAVSVALDTELNREVALKQLLDRHADDPASRQRFLMEAVITGGLEHPGIVPVYGLGSHDGGRPYYAMRFIRGDNLQEAIERFHADGSPGTDPGRRSLELRKLLRRFLDVCNAVEYAHSRGVLHRDIKPGNIILGRHGETLVVDWGLAKPIGRAGSTHDSGESTLTPSSTDGTAETLAGSALGTPSYMSPEQAAGDLARLGPRSDVYSLGATLYCLLTGKPAFGGKVADVLREVQGGEFAAPRQLDPSLDGALEAVCLKAMATRPEDRYASCRALAEDVERWMADEPVSAWRERFARKARRWANRNRVGVAAAMVGLIAGMAGLAAVLAVQTRAKADIARSLENETRANRALADANAELLRSKAAVQGRYDLAVEAIKTFHTGVSEDFLLGQDQFRDLRDRLLRSAADFYRKLSALLDGESDLASRRSLARSNFELADLTFKVGRTEDALEAHRTVLAAREALASEPGAGDEERADLGRSLIEVGRLLEATGKSDESLATFRRAESLLEGPAGSDPTARAALADCRSRLGYLLSGTGKTAEGLAAYLLARSDQAALASAPGASDGARRDLAETYNRIGFLLRQTGRLPEAEAEHRAALAIQERLAAENPAVTTFRRDLALSHNNLGFQMSRTGRLPGAEAEHRAALAIQERLATENPAVTTFRRDLAGSHNSLGLLLKETGRLPEAEAEHRAALAIQERLAAENPAVTEFRRGLAGTHNSLGLLLRQTGRLPGAEAEHRAALAIQERLAAENPAVTAFRRGLAGTHNNLGLLMREAGRLPGAEAEHRAALAIQERLAAENPKVPGYRSERANTLNHLSVALRRLGRPDEARGPCERALADREALLREDPKAPGYRAGLAESHANRGLVRHALGDFLGAAADARRAIGLWDGVPSRTGEWWFLSACPHAALSGLAARPSTGVSAAEGPSEAEAALALLFKAVALGYRSPEAFRAEDALDPIRDRPEFRLLIMDLAFPADPLAPGP